MLSGQDTDLDKGLLDAIAEPLTHIVRNAVSHGLENPRERELAGKNPTGIIRLDAYHQANQLIVEVSDDGAGIDANRLKTKALKIDLINVEEAERMSPAEALDLIFRPGFSTAEEITEISGRGVGLDVVRSVLHRLKGTVELETQLGHGTKFRLKLPLTLAIIKALLFRIEQRLYAIPLNAVAEIARANESEIHHVNTTEVLQLRNQVLPLARLGQGQRDSADARKGKFFVLVTTLGDRKLGLVVDALEKKMRKLLKDFHQLPNVEFEHSYDLTVFFEEYDFLKQSKIAELAGMNPGLLRQYASGVKHPSPGQAKKIEKAVHDLAKELKAVSIYAEA